MGWPWTNIDWSATGAMVQAVGSVVAIGAAIWIDQGAARRAHEARRDERAAADHAMREAIGKSVDALAWLLEVIERSPPDRSMESAAADIVRTWDGVLKYFLKVPGADPETVSTVLFARERISSALSLLGNYWQNPAAATLRRLRQALKEAIGDIRANADGRFDLA